jgi:nitroreductase
MTESTSPNPTIDLLLRRKSIRDYTDQPILPEVKAQLLGATLRAPTAGNMTLYTIIEVQDPALKQRLAVTCDDQPFIAKAPLVLLFLADYQRWEDYYTACGVDELCALKGMQRRHPQEGDLFLACCDALIAAQTAVLAADALGLGSCYIGDIMEHFEEHRQMFDLPRYVFPIAMVCFGYPTEGQLSRPQTDRFEQKYVIFTDRYHHQDRAELAEMFRSRQERIFTGRERIGEAANFGQLNYLKKFSAEFSHEMTRSVRAILDAWRGDENSGH